MSPQTELKMRIRKHIALLFARRLSLSSLASGFTEEGKHATATMPDAEALAGVYSSPASTMSLTLEKSGDYTAEWHDCFVDIPNNRRVGKWILSDGQITLDPPPSVMLEGLRPVEYDGEWVLVPTGKAGRFLCERLVVARASFHKSKRQNNRPGDTHAACAFDPDHASNALYIEPGDRTGS